MVHDATVGWNENRSQNSLCNMHTTLSHICMSLCDRWLPALKMIRCTLRANEPHAISIKLLVWRANWYSAFVAIAIRLSLATSCHFPIAVKTIYAFLAYSLAVVAHWRRLSFRLEPCRTSFGCHHRQFVVITIETKWRGFESWMCHTYLVAERV